MTPIRVFHLLQLAHSALFRATDRALKIQLGISTTQQAVLFALIKKDGQPIMTIADQLNMGKSSLTGLVDRMSDKGLVQRQQSTEDARSFEVFITDAGREAVGETVQSTRRMNEALLAPFSSDERVVIDRFLRHVATNSTAIVATEMKTKTPSEKASS